MADIIPCVGSWKADHCGNIGVSRFVFGISSFHHLALLSRPGRHIFILYDNQKKGLYPLPRLIPQCVTSRNVFLSPFCSVRQSKRNCITRHSSYVPSLSPYPTFILLVAFSWVLVHFVFLLICFPILCLLWHMRLGEDLDDNNERHIRRHIYFPFCCSCYTMGSYPLM
jgi:hypothetical protein